MAAERNEEVDQLMLNAQLRDQLEPYLDESLVVVDTRRMPTSVENEYLASMLEWERAPAIPISRWFRPELRLPAPENLSDSELSNLLWEAIRKLYRKRIALDFTEHLSDRQLYCLIVRDILPSTEKKVSRNTFLHWQCIDMTEDPDVWLRLLRHTGRARRLVRRNGRATASVRTASLSTADASATSLSQRLAINRINLMIAVSLPSVDVSLRHVPLSQ